MVQQSLSKELKISSPLGRAVSYLGRRVISSIFRVVHSGDVRRIRPLFDPDFYAASYPDVAGSGIDPAVHFLLYGARELRQPHPLFDAAYYAASNRDLPARGNVLLHYLESGWKDGRRPNPIFDPEWYSFRYALTGLNPLIDFIRRRAAGDTVLPRPSLAEFLSEWPRSSEPPLPGVSAVEFPRFAEAASALKSCGRPVILAIRHSLGGGVEEHVRRLSAMFEGKAEFVVLAPFGTAVGLSWMSRNSGFSLAFDPVADYPALLDALRRCGVSRIHLHHLHGHRLDIGRLIADTALPFDFTAHDYFVLCPQMHLSGTAGRYCGERGPDACRSCLAERPSRPPRTIEQWRRDFAWVLRDSSRVIAPSCDTAARLLQYAPELELITASHPENGAVAAQRTAPPLDARESMRIAVLGVLSWHKGLAVVRACSRLARRRGLPLEFVLIGSVHTPLRSGAEAFRQTGKYHESSLPDLLASVRPHLVWFPAQTPETHSYTLGAALRAGLPVVVPDLGALPERVAGLNWAWILPPFAEPKALVGFFLEIRRRNFLPCVPPDWPPLRDSASPDFYEHEYLAPALDAMNGSTSSHILKRPRD